MSLMNWLLRLHRLCRQSAIRLPRRDLQPVDLQTGDRLRVASRWWKIVDRVSDGQSTTFRLRSDDSGSEHLLVADGLPGGARRWRLVRGGRSFEVDGRILIHFPKRASRKPDDPSLVFVDR